MKIAGSGRAYRLVIALALGLMLAGVMASASEEITPGAGVYHWILYGDGRALVDVDCFRRGYGSWGPQSSTARL